MMVHEESTQVRVDISANVSRELAAQFEHMVARCQDVFQANVGRPCYRLDVPNTPYIRYDSFIAAWPDLAVVESDLGEILDNLISADAEDFVINFIQTIGQ